MPGKVRLEITQGPMKGKAFSFEEHDIFLFGRSTNCHVSLPHDPYVSRHHFLLEANPPDARIRDLGSLSGTYVNFVKYGGRSQHETPQQAADRRYPEVDLKDGDKVQVGETVFSVFIEKPTHVDLVVKCQVCGNDVSEEVGGVRSGNYVCRACNAAGQDDPLQMLRKMGREVAAATGGDKAPDIPGYQVEKKLGQGGMGAVYLARRAADNAVVALKVMLSKVAVDERSRAAFLREMDTQRKLQHPNIVAFGERGAIGSVFWFVTEYCNGGSVADLMTRCGGKLPLRVAAPILLHALKGLAHAHDTNFVHRDLKPHNLLLQGVEGHWTAKIGDFGLAKNFQKAGLSGMTTTGSYGGTYAFMAPEQIVRFKYVQPTTDVWSIAATFYTMITGYLPRELTSADDPINVVLQGPVVPIQQRDSSIPAPLAEVVHRALSRNPALRYPSAGRFRHALLEALQVSGGRRS